MIELRGPNGSLIVAEDTTVNVEFRTNLVRSELDDSYSLPFEVPIRGNERWLQFAHILANDERPTIWYNIDCYVDGLFRHTGDVYFEGGTTTVARLSYAVNGLIARVKDKKLNELDLGAIIHVAEMGAWAKGLNEVRWPDAPCCFPTHYNPEFYGEANRDFFPEISEVKPSISYEAGTVVGAMTGTPLSRMRYWQRLTTGAGDPWTYPDDWTPVQLGILNRWNSDDADFYRNPTEGPTAYYSLVPWLYTKEILLRALSAFGLRPTGTWYTDPRDHHHAIASNCALDGLRKKNYFRATQVGEHVVSHSGAPDLFNTALHGEDETTLPNADDNGIWNNSTMRWTVPEAASYIIRVTVRQWTAVPTAFNAQLVDADGIMQSQYTNAELLNEHRHTFDLYVTWFPEHVGMAAAVVIPSAMEAGTILSDAVIEVYDINDPATGNTFAREFRFADHVPDLTLAEFLLEVRDVFNVHIKPDLANGVVAFDRRNDTVLATKGAVDLTPMLRGPVELDLTSRISGIKFTWNDRDELFDPTDRTALGMVATDADAPTMVTQGAYFVIRSSREVFVGARVGNAVRWQSAGWSLPDRLLGPQDENTLLVSPALSPARMEWVHAHGTTLLMPVVRQPGRSKHFNTGYNAPLLRMAYFHGLLSNGDGWQYPFASPFAIAPDHTVITDATELDHASETGMYQREWRAWAQALVGSTPLKVDLELNANYMLGRDYEKASSLLSQPCIVDLLPVVYGTRASRVTRGARLLRLNAVPIDEPVVQVGVPPAFVCEGAGYGSVTLGSGAMVLLDGTSTHFTYRLNGGEPVTIVNEGGYAATIMGEGSYCIYATDADGELDGMVTGVVFTGACTDIQVNGWELLYYYDDNQATPTDLSGQAALVQADIQTYTGTEHDFSDSAALRRLYVGGTSITTILFHPDVELEQVAIANGNIDQDTMDFIGEHMDVTVTGKVSGVGGTSAPPTPLSAAATTIQAYRDNGNTFTTN